MTNNNGWTQKSDKGILIVLSGPSGVGKGTVCSALRQCTSDLVYSVSATTRSPRAGEQEGVNYFFKSKEQFLSMIERDELLEWAEYVGNYYGTPREFVRSTLDAGKDIILEIEVQGALKVKQKFPEGVFIFLLPPSLDELEQRIVTRGTDSMDAIRSRMNAAREEIALLEHYDYAIVNDRVELACQRIQAILEAEHCKKERYLPVLQKWLEEVH
ncbi:guanylate kinase [Paenibacillus aurantius]|uniref:Guanylate kinase n=1 Tax=Paenibacillus aurantius TaxID=2918900 RepID=A0AA96LI49_9BACL|nr:guanylate kinase [Paenibacillus aurantius]WNQ13665.1 guanylate kinase [Paenibacillus aurantius]